VIRRTAFEAVGGFDPDFFREVDWELAIRLAKRYEFEYVPELLTERRIHGDNISTEADHADVYRMIAAEYGTEIRRYLAIEREFEARRNARQGSAAIERAEHRSGIAHHWAAFRYDPTAFRALLAVLSLFGPRAFDIATRVRRAIDARSGARWLATGMRSPSTVDGRQPRTDRDRR
jgi:hypothetical protein